MSICYRMIFKILQNLNNIYKNIIIRNIFNIFLLRYVQIFLFMFIHLFFIKLIKFLLFECRYSIRIHFFLVCKCQFFIFIDKNNNKNICFFH